MMPKRIQRKRTKGWRMPPNTVYVGRPTKWGNPYSIGDEDPFTCLPMGREAVVYWYALDLDHGVSKSNHAIREEIRQELGGKNLCCWCRLDQACHADVLLEIANDPNAPDFVEKWKIK